MTQDAASTGSSKHFDEDAAPPVVALRGISKSYGGVHALVDVSAHISSGECVAIVGDNGAGKSTLVKIMSGAIQPDRGEFAIDGNVHRFRTARDARNAGIETVFQDLAVVEELDVVSNLFLGRELSRGRLGPMNRRKMRAEAARLLARTGVVIPRLRTAMRDLSGGQRQGVAIARAAGWGSRVIIMDEPTAALGVQETERVEGIIRGLKEEHVTTIVVSHNLRQVMALADHIWVLRRGRLVGTLERASTSADEIVRLITGANLSLDQFA